MTPTTPLPVVTGPANVFIDGYQLGFTRNGAEIRHEAHFADIPGDENGGDEGPPIEIVHLGEMVRVRLELTKYDATQALNVMARVKGGVAGQPPAAGTLMFANNKHRRVTLDTRIGGNSTVPANFPRCIVREPIELNKGTKFSTLVIEFTAYKDPYTGVLWDANVA